MIKKSRARQKKYEDLNTHSNFHFPQNANFLRACKNAKFAPATPHYFWCFDLTLNHPKDWRKKNCVFMGNEKCLWTPWLISDDSWRENVFKGEVRTINDRKKSVRRSCMKNNGKSPTFKFVSGEEGRPSEVQRISPGWRLPSADLTWIDIRKWLEIQAPELSEVESVELELGSCCSDLDKQVSDEICRTQKRQFENPFRL